MILWTLMAIAGYWVWRWSEYQYWFHLPFLALLLVMQIERHFF
jgi:hypothetical protein